MWCIHFSIPRGIGACLSRRRFCFSTRSSFSSCRHTTHTTLALARTTTTHINKRPYLSHSHLLEPCRRHSTTRYGWYSSGSRLVWLGLLPRTRTRTHTRTLGSRRAPSPTMGQDESKQAIEERVRQQGMAPLPTELRNKLARGVNLNSMPTIRSRALNWGRGRRALNRLLACACVVLASLSCACSESPDQGRSQHGQDLSVEHAPTSALRRGVHTDARDPDRQHRLELQVYVACSLADRSRVMLNLLHARWLARRCSEQRDGQGRGVGRGRQGQAQRQARNVAHQL